MQVEVVYESIPGWKTDITKMRSWDELPQAAKQYVARIEELIGVPCKWIGVGPGRMQLSKSLTRPSAADLDNPYHQQLQICLSMHWRA